MSKTFPISLTVVVGIVAILAGLGIGALFFHTIDGDNGNGDDEKEQTDQSEIILESASKDKADEVWDPEHHTLIDIDSVVEGRVIMIEIAVEEEEDQYHFLLLPDKDFLGMINDENVKSLRGAIMVELLRDDDSILPRIFIGQHLKTEVSLLKYRRRSL